MILRKIEYTCQCDSCAGTGLYIGMAEKDGAAVVCHDCTGTGQQHVRIQYAEFEGKKRRYHDVKRVFQTNPGFGIGAGTTRTGEDVELKDFGGMPYEDWFDGKPFPKKSEMRKFTCPAWWYQNVDSSKKPDWKKCTGVGEFKRCPHFSARGMCWEKWDREQKKGKS